MLQTGAPQIQYELLRTQIIDATRQACLDAAVANQLEVIRERAGARGTVLGVHAQGVGEQRSQVVGNRALQGDCALAKRREPSQARAGSERSGIEQIQQDGAESPDRGGRGGRSTIGFLGRAKRLVGGGVWKPADQLIVWVPLVETRGAESLWLVPVDQMRALDEQPFAEAQRRMLRAASPLPLSVGEVLIMDAFTGHGAPVHHEDRTRVSVDIRLSLSPPGPLAWRGVDASLVWRA